MQCFSVNANENGANVNPLRTMAARPVARLLAFMEAGHAVTDAAKAELRDIASESVCAAAARPLHNC